MEYAPLISTEQLTDAEAGTDVMRNCHTGNIGHGFITHSHPWSHTVTCTQGSVKVTVDGVEITLTPESEAFTMPETSLHSLEVLEDGTEFFTEHPADLSGYVHIPVFDPHG